MNPTMSTATVLVVDDDPLKRHFAGFVGRGACFKPKRDSCPDSGCKHLWKWDLPQFAMIWLYGQPWFGNFNIFGVNMRDLFQLYPINLSFAVWVGFLALFGIAVDNGVVVATYLKQSFERRTTESIAQIREATLIAGLRRVRPCLMTTATTILALLPVLTSTGRGSDIMIPMAIPSVGGMLFVLLTLFSVPVLYCLVEEWKLKRSHARASQGHHPELNHEHEP